jgi:hypothetical protein
VTPQSAEELEQVCREICPACAKGEGLRYRPETQEYTHNSYDRGGFSHSFCLASNYRNRYKDAFGG